MKKQEKNEQPACEHCRGAQYVLAYWLEKMLKQESLHMTDIPPDVFKLIPVEYILFCHCHILLTHIRRKQEIQCHECGGTAWRFTETAEQEGHRWKKVENLVADDIKMLPCEYFERCPCGYEDQGPKSSEKKKVLKDVLGLLDIKIKIPTPSFGF
ncbi:MAG: hypothetical protein Q8R76_06565 [Candidatus Omnitrophota bacterium]|nr:hypothetical protein [Candidatus Omnitrophota bacterium]